VLTLDRAIDVALGASEQIAIATAGVTSAEGVVQQAHSERLPQLFGSASYDRTLASEFSGLFGEGTSCLPLQADPTAPLVERVAELERAFGCPSTSFGGNTSGDDGLADLPFGQKNIYRLGLSFTQAVYAGGRIAATERQARLRRDNASLTLSSTRAQNVLDVSQAFYDAALADRLVTIAEETYAQADRAFAQATAQREAGRVSEFEALRARVSRDTLQPDIVRARATRQVAYLRLKQLLDFPLNAQLSLAAGLEDRLLPPPERFAAQLSAAEAQSPVPERVTVTQAANEVSVADAAVTVARSERLPAVSLRSDYGLVAYPGSVPAFDDWRTNWTVGVGLSVPVFTGGRLAADETIARAGTVQAQAQLRLARELAALDTESVRQELQASRAAWEASGATIEQAARAYDIAELRFKEGISTELELSDARLQLAQAEATRARAARDLQVQRIHFALLPYLPLGNPGPLTSGAAATATTGTQPPAPVATPPRSIQNPAVSSGTPATAAQGGRQ
jgi:outer membrane protein TolC